MLGKKTANWFTMISSKKTNINSAGVYKIVPDDGYLLDEVEVDANGILLEPRWQRLP